MKRLPKIILGILLLAAIIIGGGFLYINSSGLPHYEVEEIDYRAMPTPENLIRGKKLVLTLCANCHRSDQNGLLVGKEMKDAADFGTIYSQNITQDTTYGIGSWSDGDLLRLLRTGVLLNGRYSPPYMNKLPFMSDEDIEAIIAFLRSDDPMVAPQAIPDQPCEPNFLAKFLCRVAFKPLPLPQQPILPPDTTDQVAWGRYLAINFDCWACHSKSFKSLNILAPEMTPGYMGGGNPIPNLEGVKIHSSNITGDKATGIGSWTEEDFVASLKYGLKKDEPGLRYPMVPFVHLTDAEAKAIFAYLKSIPAIKHDVPRTDL